MRKALIVAAMALAAVAAGCGEKSAVTVYKAGQYQGKPDMQPWDNSRFNGDRGAWENAVKTRNLGQNEYVRAAGG